MRSKIQTEELRPAMGKLIYSAITSLDGFVEDEDGHFDWAAPDEEVHAFVNDLERPIGTYLYGLNRPGIPGGSIPWKRGWSHGQEGHIEAVSA
jgi:hypothetical protein